MGARDPDLGLAGRDRRRARRHGSGEPHVHPAHRCLSGLPAAIAPRGQVGSLAADRRVVPVARVDPGLVREPAEELLDDSLVEGREVHRRGRAPHATREQAVSGEDVRLTVRVVVDQRDAAGGVTDEVDHRQLDRSEAQRIAIREEDLGLDRDVGRVERVRERPCGRRSDDLAEPLPVVAVPVGRDDAKQTVLPDEVEQAQGLRGGIDQDLFARLPAAQQVRVVVHRADGQFGDDELGQLAHVSGAPWRDLAGVVHLLSLRGVLTV